MVTERAKKLRNLKLHNLNILANNILLIKSRNVAVVDLCSVGKLQWWKVAVVEICSGGKLQCWNFAVVELWGGGTYNTPGNLYINYELEQQIIIYSYNITFLYMFRGINAHLQEVALYTCSIWYRHSLRAVVVADRYTDRPPRPLVESDGTICYMYTMRPPED